MAFNDKKLVLKKTHDFCAASTPALTVVMLHGIASDSSNFKGTLEFLEGVGALRAVRFVTFDLLGWGQSEKSDEFEYDYAEQVEALHNSIEELQNQAPLVLLGHSMGTMIAARYAETYKQDVRELILISPPIYTEENLESKELQRVMHAFVEKIRRERPEVVESRSFNNSVKNIILDKRAYKVLAGLKTPAVLIWGEKDEIIASPNIPKIVRENPQHLTAIQTPDGHSLSEAKCTKLVPILEGILNE